jgi:hypothetical protein
MGQGRQGIPFASELADALRPYGHGAEGRIVRRSTDEIRAEIASILAEWVSGAALYEPTGVMGLTMFDCRRKVILSRIGALIIENTAKNGEKMPTEKVFEALTHSQPDYVAFIEQSIAERKRYLELNARMGALRGELALAEMREQHDSFI